MASAGSPALPKMAAGGQARGGSRTETPGSALPERRRRERLLGCCAEGSLEAGSPAAASAQPAGEASPAAQQQQQRGGPQTPGQCTSQKAAEKRPSKRLKTEQPGLVKPELSLPRGSATLSVFVQTRPTDEDQCSEDPGDHAIIHQQKGESIPEEEEKEHHVSLQLRAVKSSDAPSEMDSGDDVHACVCSEENSSESALSDGSGLEDTGLPAKVMRLDSSTFVDEDSNQPMPMDRFFGNVEFLQDLPAVALPSTTMSRRELRKLHFIAKEEEEEEDVV